MSNPNTDLETHRVAVVVLLDAQGADLRDAYNVGEAAVQAALDAAGPTITTQTFMGYPRESRLVEVESVSTAFRNGLLDVAPKPAN
ncbi:hypothetical protein [Amycolatopsis sp. NPDC058986]|uniref:hypothetical protein n=1 Tax=unclassified Amycolatopsis TaxID=2618356 RepID=UPI00366B452C